MNISNVVSRISRATVELEQELVAKHGYERNAEKLEALFVILRAEIDMAEATVKIALLEGT